MIEQTVHRVFPIRPARYLVDNPGSLWANSVQTWGYQNLDEATVGARGQGRVTEVVEVTYEGGMARTTEKVILPFAPMIEDDDVLQILANLPPGSVQSHSTYGFGRGLSISMTPEHSFNPNLQDMDIDIERTRDGAYRASRRNKTVNASLAIVNKRVRARLRGRA